MMKLAILTYCREYHWGDEDEDEDEDDDDIGQQLMNVVTEPACARSCSRYNISEAYSLTPKRSIRTERHSNIACIHCLVIEISTDQKSTTSS
jgi:hypothetical protein